MKDKPRQEVLECRPAVVQFRTLYTRGPRVRVSFVSSPSLTKQSFKDECDVNNIIRRYVRTGSLAPSDLMSRAPIFADVSAIGDYQYCLEVVQEAREGFATLPAAVRERFQNDPAALVTFLADVNNKDEAVRLGLVKAPVVPEPAAGKPAA